MRRTVVPVILVALATIILTVCGPVQAAHLIGTKGPSGNADIVNIDTSAGYGGDHPFWQDRFTLTKNDGSAVGFGVTGLAVDDGSDILYACGGAGWGQISVFDLTTGQELVDSGSRFTTGYGGVYGLEFLYDETNTGRLFSIGVTGTPSQLYVIEYNLAGNGLPTGIKEAHPVIDPVGKPPEWPGPINAAGGQGLAYNLETGMFYTNTHTPIGNSFWEFDAEGNGTYMFSLGMSGTNGLGYEEGLLYGLSAGHAANLVYFDLENSPHQILVADNTQVPNGWGLTGATTPRLVTELPGDVDGNGVVDGLDLTAVLTAWETEPGDPLWNEAADLDDNNVVNGLDLTEVISNWTVTSAAAPEGSASDTDAKPGRAKGNGGKKK